MGFSTRKLATILLTAAVGTLPAAAGATQAAPEQKSGTESGQPASHRNVLRATLQNGLRVVIVPDPLAPVVATELNYRVGSNEAPKGFPGMAHAQEHMMFRGSPGLSAAQLADIGAAMGGHFDADTRQTVTQYQFTVPAEELDVALHIEAIRMRGVLDTEALWKAERGAIEQEVASDLSNPGYVLYKRILAAMFHGTPYAHDALGTRPSFNETTGAMLKKFHETWYAPNNAILVIAGDVDPQQTLAKVKQLFADIPAKKLPARPPIQLQPVHAQTIHMSTDQPTGEAMLVFRLPGSQSSDYAAVQILADVLTSQRGALYGLVPAGKALDAGFDLMTLPKAGLGFAAGAFSAGDDGAKLASEIRSVVQQTIAHGVSPDLVEAAKRQELTQAETRKNSVSGLADLWSEALAVQGRHSPEENIRAIQAVTVADVNRVARQYLDSDNALVAVMTPKASGAPSAASGGFGGKESFAPQHPQKVKLPEWARTAVGRLTVPDSLVKPVVSTLPNGLKLIVQPESVSNTVSVYGEIKNRPSVEEPKGQEGVDRVLGNLFSYGSTTLDRLAFQKALDDIGAQESAGTDFSVQVLETHFERGVELLAQNELHPALPEHAFKVIRRQVASAVAGQLKSPDHLAQKALEGGLFPAHDPTLRQATPETVSKLSLADVRAYYHKAYRPDLTTIVVIGKIDPQQAKRVIEKYFGGWQASGPKPATEFPAVPPNKPSTTVVPDSSRVQDRVRLAETLGLTRDNPDYYALQLGNHVLGGAFYATRLYRDLRERTGLVYYVGSSLDVGKTRGVYVVSYACDPDKVAQARAIIVRDLKQIRDQPVSAHELVQAKGLLLRQIPLSESSFGSIAGGLLSRATRGLPLDEPTLAAHRYVKLTAKQVQAAFAKYLRPNDLVQVTQGPKPD